MTSTDKEMQATRKVRQEIAYLLQTVYHAGLAATGDRDSASWEHGHAVATIAIKRGYLERARKALNSAQELIALRALDHFLSYSEGLKAFRARPGAMPRTHAACDAHGLELKAAAEALAKCLDIDAFTGLIYGHAEGELNEAGERAAETPATPATPAEAVSSEPATSEDEAGFVAGFEACRAGAPSEYRALKGGELRRLTPARVWIAVEPARAAYARGYIDGFMAAAANSL